jgi:hypothetical protein
MFGAVDSADGGNGKREAYTLVSEGNNVRVLVEAGADAMLEIAPSGKDL